MAADQQPGPHHAGHVRAPIPTIARFRDDIGDQSEDIAEWLATFDSYIYMIEASMPEGQQLRDAYKSNMLMILLGREGSHDYRRNPDFERIQQMTFAEVRTSVRDHFRKKPSKYKARCDLYKRIQEPGETVHQYKQALRRILEDCQYDNPDDILCSHLIYGTNDAKAQQDLMSRAEEPDLATTLRVLEAYETAAKETTAFRTPVAAVGSIQGKSRQINFQNPCTGCGSTQHTTATPTCPAKGQQCSKCGVRNHFARVCRGTALRRPQGRGGGQQGRGRGGPRGRGRGQRRGQVQDGKLGTAIELDGTAAAAKDQQQTNLIQCQFYIRNVQGMYTPVVMAVDTGANISLMKESTRQKYLPDIPVKMNHAQISCADGRTLSGRKGTIHTKVAFAGRTQAGLFHIVDDKGMDVVGLNFLRGLKVKINCEDAQVIATAISVTDVKTEFPMLFKDDGGTYHGTPHTIKIHPGATPVAQRLRPVPHARQKATEEAIRKLDSLGIWEPVEKSEWAHPMVSVPKKDGSMRITTDLTKLNEVVIPDRQPLPRIKDIFQQLAGARVFSKLDLKRGYYHIPLDEESRDLTTTLTPLGLRRYRRLPMGLKDSASAFQRRVNHALKGLDGIQAYIDDVLIYGKNQAEHDLHLRTVLSSLDKAGFRLQERKLIISTTAVPAFGFIVSADGIFPDPANIQAILDAEAPTELKQLQRFLGMITYFQDFIKDAADLTEPLRQLMRNDVPFHWGREQETAFQVLKKKLAEQTRLQIFDPVAKTFVTIDASDVGIGAILSQISPQTFKEVPTAFFNRTLDTAQRNYAATEKEALACVLACEHWEQLLLGRKFTLRTDHQALRQIFTTAKNRRQSSKFQRWKERLDEFDFTIEHIPGGINKAADYLSRLTNEATKLGIQVPSTAAGIQLQVLQDSADKDQQYQKRLQRMTTKQWRKDEPQFDNYRGYPQVTVRNRLLYSCGRIIPPETVRQPILLEAHKGHPGATRMKALLRKTYTWPRQATQVDQLVQQCQQCQNSTKSRGPVYQSQTKEIPRPKVPGKQWALDITGPFPNGQYIVVLIDYATRYPEVLITKNTAATILIPWIQATFARFGLPDGIVTDNGPQFISREFRKYVQENDIHHYRTAVYNPQENGLVERFNRYLKQGIQTFKEGRWNTQVEQLIATYRNMPNETGRSPMEAFLGRSTRTPVEPNTTMPLRRTSTEPEQRAAPQINEQFHGWSPYKLGQKVLTKKDWTPKGTSPWSGPKTVVQVKGTYTYLLDDGQVWNARRLKKWIRKQPVEDDAGDEAIEIMAEPRETQPLAPPAEGRKRRHRRRPETERLRDGLTPYFTPAYLQGQEAAN